MSHKDVFDFLETHQDEAAKVVAWRAVAAWKAMGETSAEARHEHIADLVLELSRIFRVPQIQNDVLLPVSDWVLTEVVAKARTDTGTLDHPTVIALVISLPLPSDIIPAERRDSPFEWWDDLPGTTKLSPSTHAPPRERPHSHSNAFPDSSTLIQEPTAEADGVPSRTYSDAPLVDTAMSEPSANPNEITPAKRGHKNKKDILTRGTTFFRGDARRAIEELGEGEYVTMQMLISLPEWWGYRSDQPVYDPPCELCRAGGFSCIQTRNSTCLQCQMRRKRCSIGQCPDLPSDWMKKDLSRKTDLIESLRAKGKLPSDFLDREKALVAKLHDKRPKSKGKQKESSQSTGSAPPLTTAARAKNALIKPSKSKKLTIKLPGRRATKFARPSGFISAGPTFTFNKDALALGDEYIHVRETGDITDIRPSNTASLPSVPVPPPFATAPTPSPPSLPSATPPSPAPAPSPPSPAPAPSPPVQSPTALITSASTLTPIEAPPHAAPGSPRPVTPAPETLIPDDEGAPLPPALTRALQEHGARTDERLASELLKFALDFEQRSSAGGRFEGLASKVDVIEAAVEGQDGQLGTILREMRSLAASVSTLATRVKGLAAGERRSGAGRYDAGPSSSTFVPPMPPRAPSRPVPFVLLPSLPRGKTYIPATDDGNDDIDTGAVATHTRVLKRKRGKMGDRPWPRARQTTKKRKVRDADDDGMDQSEPARAAEDSGEQPARKTGKPKRKAAKNTPPVAATGAAISRPRRPRASGALPVSKTMQKLLSFS